MAERVCADCGEKKPTKGGKICSKHHEHFVCRSCILKGTGILSSYTNCPICSGKLK